MRSPNDDIEKYIDDLFTPAGSPTGDTDNGYSAFPDIDFDKPSAAELRRQRRQWRASITESALLTGEEVAEALPGRATTIRKWLDRVQRRRLPNGQEVYLWGDILRALERVA